LCPERRRAGDGWLAAFARASASVRTMPSFLRPLVKPYWVRGTVSGQVPPRRCRLNAPPADIPPKAIGMAGSFHPASLQIRYLIHVTAQPLRRITRRLRPTASSGSSRWFAPNPVLLSHAQSGNPDQGDPRKKRPETHWEIPSQEPVFVHLRKRFSANKDAQVLPADTHGHGLGVIADPDNLACFYIAFGFVHRSRVSGPIGEDRQPPAPDSGEFMERQPFLNAVDRSASMERYRCFLACPSGKDHLGDDKIRRRVTVCVQENVGGCPYRDHRWKRPYATDNAERLANPFNYFWILHANVISASVQDPRLPVSNHMPEADGTRLLPFFALRQ